MNGIIPKLFDEFEKRMLNNPHAQIDFMTRNDLNRLEAKVIAAIVTHARNHDKCDISKNCTFVDELIEGNEK